MSIYSSHCIIFVDRIAPHAVEASAGVPGTPGATDGTGAAAKFNYPMCMCYHRGASFRMALIADALSNKIRSLADSGTAHNLIVGTLAGSGGSGGSDAEALSATFNGPSGCVLIPAAGVTAPAAAFITEYGTARIRRLVPVTNGGTVSTMFSASAPIAELWKIAAHEDESSHIHLAVLARSRSTVEISLLALKIDSNQLGSPGPWVAWDIPGSLNVGLN